ncbi:hypothetical protein HYU19_05975 [Candidatus Woesearchaeota archaeon]|nr:hypothetical protein [Candidatus Woesearchaeota archaeon]
MPPQKKQTKKKPAKKANTLAELIVALGIPPNLPYHAERAEAIINSSGSNLDDVFGELLVANPHMAYNLASAINDPKRLGMAGYALLETDPGTAYLASDITGDKKLQREALERLAVHDPRQFADLLVDPDRHIKDIVPSRLIRTVARAMLSENPLLAYQAAIIIGDRRLLASARKRARVETSGEELYHFAKEHHDEQLLEYAREELISDPDFGAAYRVGSMFRDKPLIKAASARVLQEDPKRAYNLAVQYHDQRLRKKASIRNGQEQVDNELINAARPSFAEHDPDRAYAVGKRVEDEALVAFALHYISKMKRLSDTTKKLVWELYHA